MIRCWSTVSVRSMTSGYARSPPKLPRLLAAKRKYGSSLLAAGVHEYQRWSSGPVVDSTANGRPIISVRMASSRSSGDPPWPSALGTVTGRTARGSRITRACTHRCTGRRSRVVASWTYRYPSRRTSWKKSEHVLHTVAEPPKRGSTMRAIIGWTTKSRPAPRKAVSAKRAVMTTELVRRTGSPGQPAAAAPHLNRQSQDGTLRARREGRCRTGETSHSADRVRRAHPVDVSVRVRGQARWSASTDPGAVGGGSVARIASIRVPASL